MRLLVEVDCGVVQYCMMMRYEFPKHEQQVTTSLHKSFFTNQAESCGGSPSQAHHAGDPGPQEELSGGEPTVPEDGDEPPKPGAGPEHQLPEEHTAAQYLHARIQ